MFVTTVPMTALAKQGRWKVEFFCAGNGTRSAHHPVVRLGEMLRERRETLDPQAFPDHVFNYIGLEHIQSLTGDLVDYRPRAGREVLSRSKVFRQGNILYGRLRPSLNKVFVADERVPEGICSGEFYVLLPNVERIRPHFARALLASRYIQDVVAGMTTGTALPRLHLDDLLAVEVPLPPLAEQLAIETYFIEQQLRRARLVRELTLRPAMALESLVSCLGERSAFEVPEPPTAEGESFAQHRLPPSANTAPRGRGKLSS